MGRQDPSTSTLFCTIESIMTDLMFSVPSDDSIERIVITADVVNNGAQPVIVHRTRGTKSAS